MTREHRPRLHNCLRRFAPRHLHLLVAGTLVLLGAGCDGSSPSEPGSPGAQATIVIVDPGGAFVQHHAAIRELLGQTLEKASSVLTVGAVTITVSADPGATILGWGIGGFADDSSIAIVVDPSFPGLGEILPERLPPLAAHEIHHVARFRGIASGGTLLEALVSEGLADRFAIELLGSPVPPWCEAFPEDQNDHYLARAFPLLDSTDYGHLAWFFGVGTDLPRWTGYTLGFRLVSAYQARHPGRSAAQLVHAPASQFRPE